MKILYLHQFFTTPKGAGGTRSFELAKRLVARGHSVTVVCGSLINGNTGLSAAFTNGKREGLVSGINVIEYELPYGNQHSLLRRSFAFLKYSWRVSLFAMAFKADLIFATSPPLTVAIPTMLSRMFSRSKIVIEVRDLWPESPKAMGVIKSKPLLWAMRVLEILLYRSAHRFVALAPGIKQAIMAMGYSADAIELVPNGSDMEENTDVGAQRLLNAPEGTLVALYAGTHGMANGLDAVLDACAHLKKRGREDIKIVLCGAGQTKDELKSRAHAENLSNVIFMDPVTKDKVPALMKGADLGLQILMDVPVFYYGTSPNKFFDYIAAALPVLVNYEGWIADMINENQCGFVVPANQPAAFADALEKAHAQQKALSILGENGQVLARREFDRDLLGTRLINWLEATVKK